MNNTFKVKKKDILINFLRENLKNKSKNNIKSLLTKEMVLVNNKVQTKYNFIVFENDVIEIRETKITNNRYSKNIKIIYEDKDIIVVNKPAGLLSIATNKEKEHTLYHFVLEYVKEKAKHNKIFIIHRLDRETSGLVIFAKNEQTKYLFQKNWDKIVTKRGYYAVVEGTLNEKEKTLKSYLIENDSYVVYETKNKTQGKLAITKYKVLRSNDTYSLLEVDIKTGRKNQIRVQLKNNGNTIVGDKKYGCTLDPLKRMTLHAYLLELIDPRNNKKLKFKLDLPYAFGKLVK